ncbi:hypothetical protein ACFY37_05990, partial [Dactylosporangium aurantiacum]
GAEVCAAPGANGPPCGAAGGAEVCAAPGANGPPCGAAGGAEVCAAPGANGPAGGANGPAGGNGPGRAGGSSWSVDAPAAAPDSGEPVGSAGATGEPYVAGVGGVEGALGWAGGLVGIGTDAVARTVPAGAVPGGGELGALAALSSASDGWGWSDVIVPPVGQTLATVVDPNRTWQSGGSGSHELRPQNR